MGVPKLDDHTALHHCATDLGHVPTRSEYARWRTRRGGRTVPADQTMAKGKSWAEVLVGADLEPRQHRLTDAELWSIVRTARQTLGSPTTGEYERWRNRCSPKPPSCTTLARRLDRGWGELFPERPGDTRTQRTID